MPSTVPGSQWAGSKHVPASLSWLVHTQSQSSHNAFPRASTPEPPPHSEEAPIALLSSLPPQLFIPFHKLLVQNGGGRDAGEGRSGKRG